MDGLETLVRESLTAHEERAPEADGLLGAVRGGVARRRRRRTGALCAALAVLVAVTGGVVAASGPGGSGRGGPGQVTFGQGGPEIDAPPGHDPPSLPPRRPPADPAPEVVRGVATGLSHGFAPHPPATVVWVETTLKAWYALEGETLDAQDGPAYVVELRLSAPTDCISCKGVNPYALTAQFAYAVIDVNGDKGGNGGEFVASKTEYQLDRIGTVHFLGDDY